MLRMNNVNKSALRGTHVVLDWRRVNVQVSTVWCMHGTTLMNFTCVSQNNVCFVYCWSVCVGLKLLCEKQQEVAQCVLPRRLPTAGFKLGVDDWAPCAPVYRLKLHEATVAFLTQAIVCWEATHEQRDRVDSRRL